MRQQDRKTANWKALAEEFHNMVKDTTPETAVRLEVIDNDSLTRGIDIYPADTNISGTFFQIEALVDFCRCKGLSCHVGVWEGKTVARIF